MARRTVTATFAGGMISDEPRPGTARYLENLVPRVDGVVPPNPLRLWTRDATAISTANGITTATIAAGWSGGGTIHPKLGFVGLVDLVVSATAAPASSAALMAHLNGFGAGAWATNSNRTLAVIRDVDYASSFGSVQFPDHGGLYPIAWGTCSTASGVEYGTTRRLCLYGNQTFVNTEDETLIIDRRLRTVSSNSYGVVRYGGSTATTHKQINSTASFVSALGTDGLARMQPASSGVWTDTVILYNTATGFTSSLQAGMYLGVCIGESLLAASATLTDQHVHELMITKVISTASTGSRVQLDRKVYFGASTIYAKVFTSNTATLQANQLSKSSATQSWQSTYVDSTSTGGFALSFAPIPRGGGGACYHQGRLWLSEGSKIRWSGTVDETMQLTATSIFATSTSGGSVTATGTFGIEYKHISLWGTNGYASVSPHIGGDIVGMVSMDDTLVVLKRGAIYRIVGGVSYDGESNAFDIQCVSNSVGPEGEFSWAETPAGIVFTWNDGIWMYDGNEVQEISRGSVANSFVENVRGHKQSSSGLGAQSVATRVCSDGDNVFFTPMRHALSTSTAGDEPAFTSGMHNGLSIHNKHLVLSIRDQKWYYISNINLNVPSAILPVRSTYGGKFINMWLNSWRRHDYGSIDLKDVEIADIHNMLHEAGPSRGIQSSTTAWGISVSDTLYSAAVSHPLLGMGNVDSVRPRSAIIKRTSTTDYGSSTSTTAGLNKITVIDSESSFVPASSGFMTYHGSTGTISGIPEWWTSMSSAATGTSLASISTSTSDQARSRWEVEGTTSTAAANSLLDRFSVENNETAMSAPSIFYYDNYYWRDKESSTVRYQKSILHVVGIEYDEVENRTDR